MKRQYFGTDGVRGPFGGPVINEAFAARLAEAAGRWAGGTGQVLIGRDTRASGEPLLLAVARGLRAAGLVPVSLGILPTPAVSRAVAAGPAVLGVVITASHNPVADNGIKFFDHCGTKLSDADELAIEAGLPTEPSANGEQSVLEDPTALLEYTAALMEQLPAQALAGWRIVLDTSNGATVATSPAVLRGLGADLEVIGANPDGQNINQGVGSEHPGPLALKVRESGARLGIAHDGDGDRCILCDETGAILDGDEILTILAIHALQRHELKASTLVTTVQSNLGVDVAVGAAGGKVVRTDVGDRYVSEGMRSAGAGLGGESSGHVICHEIGPTGDGLGAALRVLRVMHQTGLPLSELRQVLRKFPHRSGAVKVREKKPLETCPNLSGEIAALVRELGRDGRVLVRYSGTEPKLRLLVEGPAETVVDAAYARLAAAVAADLT